MNAEITAHMIVRNEQQWIWYAIASVLDHVKKILIYDTGSVDKTVSLIRLFRSPKIQLELKGEVSARELAELRNEQLKKTKTKWFMLLDGDEIWPETVISELKEVVKHNDKNLHAIVMKARVPVGDLFHYQAESAGRYQILDKTGHYNIRGYRLIKGYKWQGLFPLEAYVGPNGIPIQKQKKRLRLLLTEYWHLTHLFRSTHNTFRKRKYEKGMTDKIKLPDVFFVPRPKQVPSPWITFSLHESIKANIFTPIVKLKRRIEVAKTSYNHL